LKSETLTCIDCPNVICDALMEADSIIPFDPVWLADEFVEGLVASPFDDELVSLSCGNEDDEI
jgi:hypothetical protein